MSEQIYVQWPEPFEAGDKPCSIYYGDDACPSVATHDLLVTCPDGLDRVVRQCDECMAYGFQNGGTCIEHGDRHLTSVIAIRRRS